MAPPIMPSDWFTMFDMAARVRQEILLHLGSKFLVKEPDWPTLCIRIRELLNRQESLLEPLPQLLEDEAERIVQQLLDQRRKRLEQANLAQGKSVEPTWKTVDISSTPDALSA